MKQNFWLLVTLLLSVLLLYADTQENKQRSAAVRPVISSTAPFNIFSEEEEVTFEVNNSDDFVTTYVITDYDKTKVKDGKTVGGKLNLGVMNTGYYEMTLETIGGECTTSFGVIPKGIQNKEGRVAVVTAFRWHYTPEQWKTAAELLKKIGISWISDGTGWDVMNPSSDSWTWTKGDDFVAPFAQSGIKLKSSCSNPPLWTHPKTNGVNPEDLRDCYKFAKEAGAHYLDKVGAWESWNEPDICTKEFKFFSNSADVFAGIQKALFLGFKAANSDIPVLSCALCTDNSPFNNNLFECGVSDYFDVFNFHAHQFDKSGLNIYIPTKKHTYYKWMDQYAFADRPVWITECGICLPPGPNGRLTWENERIQADFIPKSIAISLMAGTDKHFFFLLRYFVEHENKHWGVLKQDKTPTPGAVALAATTRLLGEARYLGEIPKLAKDAHVCIFDTGKYPVAVCFSKQPPSQPVKWMLASYDKLEFYDSVGRKLNLKQTGQVTTIPLSSSPIFIKGFQLRGLGNLVPPIRPPGRMPKLNSHKVIMRASPVNTPFDREHNGATCYYVRSGDKITYGVECCNLNETDPASGFIQIEVPKDWVVSKNKLDLKLEPMGRHYEEITLTVGSVTKTVSKVTLTGKFGGKPIAPSVSWLVSP